MPRSAEVNGHISCVYRIKAILVIVPAQQFWFVAVLGCGDAAVQETVLPVTMLLCGVCLLHCFVVFCAPQNGPFL